jgi:FHS family L-fucose permease-like MFS transporter
MTTAGGHSQTARTAPELRHVEGAAGAFATVTTLFFAWGFITSMIDPLVATVRALFSLSYTEALLTQFAFFTAYGLVSIPAAFVVLRLSYSRSVLVSVATMFLGVLVMLLAAHLDAYVLVLAALFVVASGITLLQVVANPLAAGLGDPARSHFRLNLAQGFNSLGTVLGPLLASRILLREGVFGNSDAASLERRAQSLGNVTLAYSIVAVALLALLGFIFMQRRRIESAAPVGGAFSPFAAFGSRWALFGAAAIFLYVGAEVSIGSVMINYLHQDSVLGLPLDRAGQLVSYYWLGAMIGRFLGSAVLRDRFPAPNLLALAAFVAACLCIATNLTSGVVAATALIAVGLANSIMFPTIFSLTLERSGAGTAPTSGLLCMAIVGGAILPLAVGRVADASGLQHALLVPAAAYCAILAFALLARHGGQDASAPNI